MKLAFYLRLSEADGDLKHGDKDESNSIENQRMLLQNYINSREDMPKVAAEYVDDGYSGTNFNRPGFLRMVEDAKSKVIDTILVKDLSRLGRNYIGVGDYLEQIFPMLGIRVIAVNSNYDSNDYPGKTMGLEMSITNLVNTLYSRDLSKKVTSAMRTKWNRGISTTVIPPFGYCRDPEHKGKWLKDEPAATYVRMIFDKALAGWNTSRIADYLNGEKIPTPSRYWSMKDGSRVWKHKVSDREWLWKTDMVWEVLCNSCYTGTLIQGKWKHVSVGGRKVQRTAENEQVVVKGAYEGIVTLEEFEKAQNVISKRQNIGTRRDIGFSLCGKIRCGNCGLNMSSYNAKIPVVYCRHAVAAGVSSTCSRTKYPRKWIEELALCALNEQLEILWKFEDELRTKREYPEENLAAKKKELQRKIEALKSGCIWQYERYAEDMITLEEYQTEKVSLLNQLADLQQQYNRLNGSMKIEKSILEKIDVEKFKVRGIAFGLGNEKESETNLDKKNENGHENMGMSNNERIEEMEDETSQESKEVQKPEKSEDKLLIRKMTREVADQFIDTIYIYGEDHVEITFTFDDLLRKLAEYDIHQGQEALE